MPPTSKGKKQPICKVCPKKFPEISKILEPPKEEWEEPKEELQPEEEGTIEPCRNADGYGDFELVTSGHVLEEILPARRRKKPGFFASCTEKMRYDNLIPCDVTNDHQYKASCQRNPLYHMSMLRVTSDPRWKRTPAIVATIGPSCKTTEQIENLILSGMNIARINLAHGDRCSHQLIIQNIRDAERNVLPKFGFHNPVAIMVDLKGSGILTGRICTVYIKDCSKPQIFLEKNTKVKLTADKYMADSCTPSLIYINYNELAKFVRPGMKIFLDDGAIKLIVQKIDNKDIICVVDEEGYLGNNRNVHVPMIPLTLPPYTPTDIEDILMAVEEDVDIITIPKARYPDAIQNIKDKLTEKLMTSRRILERPIMLFSKISTFEGLTNIDRIIEESDGIVIQRGDLGMDMPPEKVFVAQREIIGKCNIAGKPVICSTHLLESMIEKIQVSRSNISDIASCILDGADCLSLTAETAIGLYPNEAIEMMNHVIREASAATYQKQHQKSLMEKLPPAMDPKIAVAIAACTVAEKVRASAIIVLTTSGKSAKFISWLRPRAVIIAVTRYERTARQMNVWRCVVPLYYTVPCTVDWFIDMERKFQHGIAYGKEFGFIRFGDPIVLVSGYGKDIGFTNCVRVVYASTNPDVYLEHPIEYYSNIYFERDLTRPQDKFPYTPCK